MSGQLKQRSSELIHFDKLTIFLNRLLLILCRIRSWQGSKENPRLFFLSQPAYKCHRPKAKSKLLIRSSATVFEPDLGSLRFVPIIFRWGTLSGNDRSF